MSEDQTPHRRTTFAVQALLFRHVYLLVFILGILSTRHTLFAITCLLLILWVDSRAWRIATCLALISCFATGYLFHTLRYEPINTSLPKWASLKPQDRAPTVYIEGRVAKVQSMTDRRLRVTLENISPKDKPLEKPLQAKLIWTWDQATTRPLVGQHIAQQLPLLPIGGFANQASFNSANYWYNKNVLLRSWSRGKKLEITKDTPRPDTVWREYWRSKVAKALGLKPYENIPKTTINKKYKQLFPPPPQDAAIIMALLFGDKYYLTTQTVELFRASGLAHSLALSGQHLSVAALLALAFVLIYGFIKPKTFEKLPHIKMIMLLSLPFAAFYLWLGSAPPSLTRAAWMLGLSTIILMQNRHRQLIDVLCLTLFIMIVIHPASLFDLSLQLSFTALAGIALARPITHKCWQNMEIYNEYKKPPWKKLSQKIFWTIIILASVSMAAQLGTLPISLITFGTQSYYSFLNLLWLPILSFWVLPTAFAGLFCNMLGLDTLGQILLHIAAWPCNEALYILKLCKNLGMESIYLLRPSWSMALGYVSIMTGIALRFNRTHFPKSAKRCLIAGCLLLCITPLNNTYINYNDYKNKTVRLRLLDVGQGQAALIEWASKPLALGVNRLLVDGGGFNSKRFNAGSGILAPILTQGRFPHVNTIIFTHPDTDHMQGLLFLAEAFDVDKAYVPITTHPNLTKIKNILEKNKIPTKYIQNALSINLAPHLRLELLTPKAMKGNNGLIARLVAKTDPKKEIGLILILGDMEKEAQKELLEKYNTNIKTQSLIVPHHGSAKNVLTNLYDTLTPTLALVSCGFGNRYAFPSKKLENTLAERSITLLSTAKNGEITLTWANGKLNNTHTFK